jgi:hypothetical protein
MLGAEVPYLCLTILVCLMWIFTMDLGEDLFSYDVFLQTITLGMAGLCLMDVDGTWYLPDVFLRIIMRNMMVEQLILVIYHILY